MFQNGFTPSIGDSFTILTFGPGKLNGTFSNVSWDSFDNGLGSFKVSYDNAAGNVVITAEAVPEPSTILLLAGGLGLMVFWISVRRGGVGTISHRTS